MWAHIPRMVAPPGSTIIIYKEIIRFKGQKKRKRKRKQKESALVVGGVTKIARGAQK